MKAEEVAALYAEAQIIVKSGLSAGKTPETIFLLIKHARELKLPDIFGITNMFIQGGKIAYNISIYTTLMSRSKKYGYSIGKISEQECEINIFYKKNGEKIGSHCFNITDAKRIRIKEGDNTTTLSETARFKNHPRQVLFANCLRTAIRLFCQDIFTEKVGDSFDSEQIQESNFYEDDTEENSNENESEILEIEEYVKNRCDQLGLNSEQVLEHINKANNCTDIKQVEISKLRKMAEYMQDENNAKNLQNRFAVTQETVE